MPLAGDLLNSYRLIRLLGQGARAEVWQAEEVLEGQAQPPVALELSAREMNLREIAWLIRQDHPHLLRCRHTLVSGELFGLVTDLAEGGSLAELLRSQPQGLPPAEVARYLAGIARALEHLHRHGVVHHGVRPDSFLLQGGVIKLGDLGMLRDGEKASDIHALGVSACQLLTGEPPGSGTGTEAPEIPPELLTRLPPSWPELLRRCLDPDPAARPGAGEVAELLLQLAVPAAVPDPPAPPPPETAPDADLPPDLVPPAPVPASDEEAVGPLVQPGLPGELRGRPLGFWLVLAALLLLGLGAALAAWFAPA